MQLDVHAATSTVNQRARRRRRSGGLMWVVVSVNRGTAGSLSHEDCWDLDK